ncbi:hypothetical protein F9802_02725 [Bacillus aerolatus]|uniref:Uncharacterized protein n=1 Tax=Bacillus aerolatus TaxID=2653354 RepID=A0A6I1FK35_9BACI|nr:hypothetical protein [Bacillus aerolatus]KAB7709058.1 hypothetical protein F9802_02725 [Bacillus aerolatus]
MNKEQEEIVVRSFFAKRLQERVIFELFSPKRREKALHRLNHDYKKTLREEYMMEIPKPNSSPMEIANLLKKHGAGKQCYVISFNDNIDGKELPLLTALEHAVGYGFPSIVSCIPNFEAEQEYGAPPRYILKRES